MIMARNPKDKEKKKAHIIELAQAIGKHTEWLNEGVLVYSLDASVEDGKGPIHVLTKNEKTENDQKTNFGCKYNAPFKENESLHISEPGHGLKVEVLTRKKKKFVVRVTVFEEY